MSDVRVEPANGQNQRLTAWRMQSFWCFGLGLGFAHRLGLGRNTEMSDLGSGDRAGNHATRPGANREAGRYLTRT